MAYLRPWGQLPVEKTPDECSRQPQGVSYVEMTWMYGSGTDAQKMKTIRIMANSQAMAG